MEYTQTQIDAILGTTSKERPPDYSLSHRNMGQYYAHAWKSAAQTRLSRTLWFLLLVMFVLFISIPMLQTLMNLFVSNVQKISS